MKEAVARVCGFNFFYAQKLLEELPEEKLLEQPAGLTNYPLWIMGHLGVCSGPF